MFCTNTRELNKRSLAALSTLTLLFTLGTVGRSVAQPPPFPRHSNVLMGRKLDKSKILPFVPWTRTGMPPGSYLSTPAVSTKQLLDQLDSNPELMKRYLRVFRDSTPREVRNKLGSLKLIRMERDTVYDVYYWHQDGEGYRRRNVKKGTYVFVDDEGKPILVQVCGNPLRNVLGLPNILKPGASTSSIQEFLEDEPLPPRRTVVLDEMQMFDMGSIQLVAPRARNINVDILPKPSIGRFAAVTPIVPPIAPPLIPSVIPPGIPPLIPPIIRADPIPNIPEPGTITLLLSSLGSGLAFGGSALRRRMRRR